MMSPETKLMAGIILLTIPSIQYGGFFLFQLLTGKQEKLQLTPFQKSMFRAGHAHAGVLVILAILAQLLVDEVRFPVWLEWFTRAGFPFGTILVSGGFFAAAIGKGIQKPSKYIGILYTGIFILGIALIILGLGLILT